MKIGNWKIVDAGIEWVGDHGSYPVITKERLQETRDFDGVQVYDWLTHMAEKAWITEEDVYSLNTAFLFALEHFKIGFNGSISFERTLKEQNKIVNRKIAEAVSH